MSRTDKDRPYWVKTNDPLENRYEHHDHRPRVVRCISGEHEEAITRYNPWIGRYVETRETRTVRDWYHGTIPVECDLAPAGGNWRWKPPGQHFSSRCTYEMYGPGYRKYWSGHAPKWWADMMNHNPMRRDSRDVLREVVKEYNANGEVEDPELYTPHRHTGWWD